MLAVLGAVPRPVSVDPGSTLRALALTGGLALLALLAAPALSRPAPAVRAVGVVAAFGFALSAFAILARARFGALLYGTIAVPTVSPFGPFVSKNHFAGWVAMGALLVAGLALGLADGGRSRGGDWTTGSRAGGVILSLVAALAMALSGLASLSRGGGAALAAGAACFVALVAWRRRGGRAGLAPSLALAGVLVLVLVALVPVEARGRLRSLSGASFRIDTWRDSLRLAAASPVLGHGLGAFHDAYPRFKRGHGIVRVEHSENDYVETLAETGIPGLALALLGLVLLLAAAGRGIAAGRDPTVRGIATGAVAALAALAVHSAVDFNLRIPSNAALAALAAAAAAGAAGVRSRALPRAAAVVSRRRRGRAPGGRGEAAGDPVARGSRGGRGGRVFRLGGRPAAPARARRGRAVAAAADASRARGIVAHARRRPRGPGRRGGGGRARSPRGVARPRAARPRRGGAGPRGEGARLALTPSAGVG